MGDHATIEAPVSTESAPSTHIISSEAMESLLDATVFEDTRDTNHTTERGVPSTDDYVRVMIQRANDIVEGEGYKPEDVKISYTPKGPMENDLDTIFVHWNGIKFVRS